LAAHLVQITYLPAIQEVNPGEICFPNDCI
jgi:hypothetical protein